jgi:perosamine synthetase
MRRIHLGFPTLDEEMKVAALDALENDRYVLGENVWKFEEEFAKYVETEYAVSISSGTHALHFALIACGVKQGVSVMTSAFSFVASANVVIHAGGKPILADIDPLTCNIDPNDLVRRLALNTAVLLPVHLYGFPAEMDELMDIAEERKLYVVEDACQAHGAEYKKKKVGAIGDVGCFSFYPSKNMSVLGDGGMIVTNNKEIADASSKLRDAGRITKYEHDEIGYTARLNSELMELGDLIKLPPLGSSCIRPVFHLFVIKTIHRDALKSWLEKSGIESGVHYPIPIHLQPVYRRLYGFKEGDFPVSEDLAETCLSLPMHPHLEDDDVRFICEQIKAFYNRVS